MVPAPLRSMSPEQKVSFELMEEKGTSEDSDGGDCNGDVLRLSENVVQLCDDGVSHKGATFAVCGTK